MYNTVTQIRRKACAAAVNHRANVSPSVTSGSPDVTLNETLGIPNVQRTNLAQLFLGAGVFQELDDLFVSLPLG